MPTAGEEDEDGGEEDGGEEAEEAGGCFEFGNIMTFGVAAAPTPGDLTTDLADVLFAGVMRILAGAVAAAGTLIRELTAFEFTVDGLIEAIKIGVAFDGRPLDVVETIFVTEGEEEGAITN